MFSTIERIQSTLSKSDTFGAGTKCPSKRDVCLIESQIKGVKKGRDQTNSRCPFYRGVRLIEVSVKRESTVQLLFSLDDIVVESRYFASFTNHLLLLGS